MNCPNCGEKISSTANFCKACGEPVTTKALKGSPESNRCPACGAESSPRGRYCRACGQALHQFTSAEDMAEVTTEVSSADPGITPDEIDGKESGGGEPPVAKPKRRRKPQVEGSAEAASTPQRRRTSARQNKMPEKTDPQADTEQVTEPHNEEKTGTIPETSTLQEEPAVVMAEVQARPEARSRTRSKTSSEAKPGTEEKSDLQSDRKPAGKSDQKADPRVGRKAEPKLEPKVESKAPAKGNQKKPAVKSNPPAGKGKGGGGMLKGLLALGLAGVLLVQCVPGIIPGLPVNPPVDPSTSAAGRPEPDPVLSADNPFPAVTFSAKELAVSGEVAAVSPEVTKVTVDGVTVDFGEYNLLAESQLEIAALPVKTDAATGTEFTTWDITLAGHGADEEFSTMVEITLPYDPAGIDPANEATAISAGWYDEASGRWLILPSTVDPAADTITFRTAHFSPKAVIKNTLNQGTSLFYYNGPYQGPNTPVAVDTGALMTELRKLETKAFEQMIRDKSVPTNELLSTGLGLTNLVTSGADYGGSVIDTLLPALDTVSASVKNKLLVVGATATFLKVMDQYARGVDSYKIARDNVFDALEILVSGVAIAYGSPLLVLVGAGIWAVGIYDQATYDPEDITSYLDRLEEVAHQFTLRQAVYDLRTGEARYLAEVPGQTSRLSSGEVRLNSKAAWALALKSIYLQSKGEPQKIKERVDQLVRTVSGLFWSLYRRDPGTLYHWIDEESGLLPASAIASKDLPWPTAGVSAYIEKMMGREVIRLHDELQPVYREMSEFEMAELRQKLLTSVLDLAETYNKTMTFELVDESLKEPGFGKSSLAEKDFVFDVPAGLTEEFRITARPEDSNQVFTCNVYHYVKAGMPKELHMYPFAGDFALRDAEFTFEPTLPVTRISLKGTPQAEVGIIEIAGPKVRSYEGHNNPMGGVKVDFEIYYQDGFPEGARITHEFDAGSGFYSSDPKYGEQLPDGRWYMKIDQDYLQDGTYQPVFQMVDGQGNVLGEASITINISGLDPKSYYVNPAIPPGDPDAGSEGD